MQINELTRSQKRIIIISGVIVLVFFFVWLLIFLPVRANVNKMKTELAEVEGEIHIFERTVSETKTLAKCIENLKTKSKVLENKFSKDLEESLKTLFNFADMFNLKIISLKPSIKKLLLDENGMEVKAEGKTYQIIYVNLVMKGSYGNLVRFRELLEVKLPGFVSIETLNIAPNTLNLSEQLTITLGFNLYFLN